MINIVCVKKADLLSKVKVADSAIGILPDPFAFFDLPVEMKSYEWLDSYDDSLLQVIPFITLVNRETREVLIYRPSDTSMTCSVGLYTVMEEDEEKKTLDVSVATQAANLMRMELGVRDYLVYQKVFTQSILDGNCGILYTEQDQRLSHRVAVSLFAFMDIEDITLPKANIFSGGQWMSVGAIQSAVDNKLFTLDPWSTSVLKVMKVML